MRHEPIRPPYRYPWTLCLGLILNLGLACAAQAAENCQLHAAPAQLDYGAQYRRTVLNQPLTTGGHALGKRLVTVNVVCQTPVRMALFLRGDSLSADTFRFGQDGALSVTASQATLDGKSVALGQIRQPGETPSEATSKASLRPNLGVVALEQGQPATGSRLALQLELDPGIPADAIRVLNSESLWSSTHYLDLSAF